MLHSHSGCLGDNRSALILREILLRFLHLPVHSLVANTDYAIPVPSTDKAAQIR